MIPIYRAKKIDKDEYVMGFLSDCWLMFSPNRELVRLFIKNKDGEFEIDNTTLAIHFPEMILNNYEIFASLQEDGKGGDIFITENDNTRDGDDLWTREEYGETTAFFSMHGLNFTDWKIEDDRYDSIYSKRFTKKIGIQQ